MPTTCDFGPGEVVLGGYATVTYEDNADGAVDLTMREDNTCVAGITVNSGPPMRRTSVRIDDLEIPVEPGDDLRDIVIRAADLGREAADLLTGGGSGGD